MKKSLALAAAFVFYSWVLSSGRFLFADQNLRLEGILYDDVRPENSTAIIEGQLVKPGGRVGNFQIVRVDRSSVLMIDQETHLQSVLVPEGKPKQPLAETPVAPKNQTSAAANFSAEGFQAAARGIWEMPGKLMNRFWELIALRELAIVNNASVNFYNSRKYFPKTFKELIEANLLPDSYASGVRRQYRFALDPAQNPTDFGLHANPVDPASHLLYFYVGTDAVIRESPGSPAGRGSRPHDY